MAENMGHYQSNTVKTSHFNQISLFLSTDFSTGWKTVIIYVSLDFVFHPGGVLFTKCNHSGIGLSVNSAKTNNFKRQHNFAGYCLEAIV